MMFYSGSLLISTQYLHVSSSQYPSAVGLGTRSDPWDTMVLVFLCCPLPYSFSDFIGSFDFRCCPQILCSPGFTHFHNSFPFWTLVDVSHLAGFDISSPICPPSRAQVKHWNNREG